MSNAKNKKNKKEEVRRNEGLIASQEDYLKEFEIQKASLEEQEEIQEIKLNTLQIVYSRNKKELTALEKDIALKRAKNSELEHQISDMDHSITLTKDSIKVKESDLNELNVNINHLKKCHTETKNTLSNLVEDSKLSTKRLLDLETQVKNKKTHIKELELNIDVGTKKLAKLNEEVEKLFYDLLASQKKESTLKKQRDLNNEKIKSLEQEILKTEKELSDIDSKTRELTSEISVQDKNISAKRQRVYDQRNEFDRLASISTEKETIKEKNNTELNELTRKSKELNEALLKKRDKISQDESCIKSQLEEIRINKEDIETAENNINILTDEIQETTKKISLHKNTLASDSIKLAKLKKELTEFECQNISYQEELRATSETKELKKVEIEK